MRRASILLTLPLFALVSLNADPAFADPPQACHSLGAACNNAGPSHDKPGVCASSKCADIIVPCEGGGGACTGGVTKYVSCMLCEVSSHRDAGGAKGDDAGDRKGEDVGGPGGGDAGTMSSSSGGCAIDPRAGDGAFAGGLMIVGLAATVVCRRRRRGR